MHSQRTQHHAHPGIPASRHPGIPATRHPSNPASQQPGIPATRHPSNPASQQPGIPATRHPSNPASQQPGSTIHAYQRTQHQAPRQRSSTMRLPATQGSTMHAYPRTHSSTVRVFRRPDDGRRSRSRNVRLHRCSLRRRAHTFSSCVRLAHTRRPDLTQLSAAPPGRRVPPRPAAAWRRPIASFTHTRCPGSPRLSAPPEN
jgi:hypothetical protein